MVGSGGTLKVGSSPSIRSHRDLLVWQHAVDFVVEVYRATNAMPKSEIYGLTGQIRRAAVSSAANVAEGSGRRSMPDFIHFLSIARCSLREVDTLLEIIGRLEFGLDVERLQAEGNEVGRLLSGLIRSLRS